MTLDPVETKVKLLQSVGCCSILTFAFSVCESTETVVGFFFVAVSVCCQVVFPMRLPSSKAILIDTN